MTEAYQIVCPGKDGKLIRVLEPWVLDPLEYERPLDPSQLARLEKIGDKTRDLAAQAGWWRDEMVAASGKNEVTVPMEDIDLNDAPELFWQFTQIAGMDKPDGDLVVGIGEKGTWRTVRLIHNNLGDVYHGWTLEIDISEDYESGPRFHVIKYYERPMPRPDISQKAEDTIRELDCEIDDISLREERLALVTGLFDFVDQAIEVALQNRSRATRATPTGLSS